MRVCAHVRLHLGIAKHLRRNGIMGTILTPEGMLWIIAYTYKRKHNAPSSFLNLANSNARTILQCFSCLQLSLSKASAKIQLFSGLEKFFVAIIGVIGTKGSKKTKREGVEWV